MRTSTNIIRKTHSDEFESPLPHHKTPYNTGVFRFIDQYGDKMGTKKNILYREPKLVTTGKKWFVEYYYRIPTEVPYTNQWKRFKVYEDINRVKTMEHAYELLNAVRNALENGFNPFEPKRKYIKELSDPYTKKQWSINQAVLHFKTMWKERGIADASLAKYNRTADRFLNWCIGRGIQHEPIQVINSKHIKAYLSEAKKEGGWSNRGYNNEKDFLSTMFIFFTSDCGCTVNPCKGISDQKTASKKHKYYDEKTFARVKEAMAKHDPYLLFACQVVYYLCIRSEKELKLFKVGNIFPERKQVLIRAEDSKTGTDRYVPMADEMLQIFKERNVFDYPADFYLFSVPAKNKFVPDGIPGKNHFKPGFFSKRFSKIREKIGLDSAHTVYSFKHTRIIHLKTDGVQDADIMSLTGHTSFSAYADYLRDLGLTANPDAINKKTRKF